MPEIVDRIFGNSDWKIHQASSTGKWLVMGRRGWMDGPHSTKRAAQCVLAVIEADEREWARIPKDAAVAALASLGRKP